MNYLIFDIETVSDHEFGAKAFDIDASEPKEQILALEHYQLQKNNQAFLPLYLQKIVCISLVIYTDTKLEVISLGDESTSEKELVKLFFAGVNHYKPKLISWNGTNFDLPVLHYRALKHGISCQTYWDQGQHDTNFKWNNYINRYHDRHTDVMDLLANFSPKAYAPLDKIAKMLNLPGKMGVSGANVKNLYLENRINDIRNYCETDVINTFFVWLKFEKMRGNFSERNYTDAYDKCLAFLENNKAPHLQEYLDELNSLKPDNLL